MKKIFSVSLILTLFLFTKAYTFDGELAKKFDGMFSQMTPEMIAKRPCEVNSKQLFEMIKKK